MNVTSDITTKDRIFAILTGHEGFVSGEAVSRQLGISRAAVNKAITALRAEGCEIESVTNRGYRLQQAPDFMNPGALLAFLPQERVERVLCVPVLASTNRSMKELAEDGASDGTVLIADAQTAGRGRVGRSFASPAGQGIYLSYLIRPTDESDGIVNTSDWSFITGRTAIAVSDAIEEVCGIVPDIKWINDLFVGGQKLCGILTQTDVEAESTAVRSIVVGIGINVHEAEEDFPEALREIATSIYLKTGKHFGRSRLAAAVIRHLDLMRESLADRDRAGYYLEKYRKRCTAIGQRLTLRAASGEACVTALGISPRFGLIVQTDRGEQRELTGGELVDAGLQQRG